MTPSRDPEISSAVVERTKAPTVDGVEDARYLAPLNWDEADLIFTALAPSLRDFHLFTGRTYTENHAWRCYAEQWKELQRCFISIYEDEGRREKPPLLVALQPWPGTIMDVKRVREFQARFQPGDEQPLVRNYREPQPQTLEWYHIYHAPQLYEKTKREVQAAEARNTDQSDRNSRALHARLEAIVARSPETYASWLTTQAYSYFPKGGEEAISWDHWCSLTAPIIFEDTILQRQEEPEDPD